MEARTLRIEEKLRPHWGSGVKPSDFKVRDEGAIDPRIVLLEPNLSLYCLDFEKRQALFVETPPECDLSRAPFLFQAQYEAATRLVRVPYETLHRLAAEVALDPSRLILIYSVGRCGSTLVSRAFNAVEGVESISEPDVFTQMLGTWGANGLDGEEQAALLRSCTLLQCVPGQIKGATAWALKFRSMVTELGPLFYALFPTARVVFLYRNAEPWARSFLRMIGVTEPTTRASLAPLRFLFGHTHPRVDALDTASPLETAALMWLSVMEKCLEMQRQGIPMFVTRYEELNRAPREALAQMFAFCGFPASAVGDLEAVLTQDSQEGTAISRTSLGETATALTQAHTDELRRIIREASPEVTADTILPGTYFPAGSPG